MAEISQQGNRDMSVRCSDLGHAGCNWEARGHNEDDIMRQVEQHGREAHKESITDRVKEKIREVMNRAA